MDAPVSRAGKEALDSLGTGWTMFWRPSSSCDDLFLWLTVRFLLLLVPCSVETR